MGAPATTSYVERPPAPGLRGVVRTVWHHVTGEAGYVQRNLPTGGVEIHWPVGGRPRLLGPLTAPMVEVLDPGTTIIGVRFLPGSVPLLPMPLHELRDRDFELGDLGQPWMHRVGELMLDAPSPGAASMILQEQLACELRRSSSRDALMGEAVRLLMPWQRVEVGGLAPHLGLSVSQLRRRCLQAVGLSPKTLQRTLRFQGFLALAQAGAVPSGRRGGDGLAGLAVDVGYADQAHLGRECLRLTGVTPRLLLGGDLDRCHCGHDHAASYRPFLALRTSRAAGREMRDLFKNRR